MTERIIIIILGPLLIGLGIYCLHWVFNIREWTNAYIENSEKKSNLKLQTKIIELLSKSKPNLVPIYIYIIVGSILILSLMLLVYLGYRWFII